MKYFVVYGGGRSNDGSGFDGQEEFATLKEAERFVDTIRGRMVLDGGGYSIIKGDLIKEEVLGW